VDTAVPQPCQLDCISQLANTQSNSDKQQSISHVLASDRIVTSNHFYSRPP